MAIFGNPTSYVGLDIGASSIKLIELIDRRRRIEVATYAQANFPNILFTPENNEQDAARRTAIVIKQMLDRAHVAADGVIAALPSSMIFSTVIHIPPTEPTSLEKAVKAGARDVIPASLDDMVLGWSQLSRETTNGTIPVFLTAAPQAVVARYKEAISLAGLDLVALEVETFSLARALAPHDPEPVMIVDIGESATTFDVVENGSPRLSHSVDIGGRAITLAIASTMGMAADAAEQKKVSEGLSGASASHHVAALTTLEKIARRASAVADRFADEAGRVVTRSILVGGGARLKGIDKAWEALVHQPTTIGNPWRGLTYPAGLTDFVEESGSTYAVAVGLARRGFEQSMS